MALNEIPRWLAQTILLLGLLAAGGWPSPRLTVAQETMPAAHHGRHDITGSAGHDSPYAEQFDPGATIRALSPETIAQIERGEGAGFALPAELNGLPGPRHVLDLADALHLSHEQQAEVRRIFETMQTGAVLAGGDYLAAQKALEDDLRSGAIDEAALAERVAEVSRLEGELATVHLLAHLQTAEILRPEQIAEYNSLRGYL